MEIILRTESYLQDTFKDLLKLKELGIADAKAKIMHNYDLLIPAGAYNDLETFMEVFRLIEDSLKIDDLYNPRRVKEKFIETTANMTAEELFWAYYGWKQYCEKAPYAQSNLFDEEMSNMVDEELKKKEENSKSRQV